MREKYLGMHHLPKLAFLLFLRVFIFFPVSALLLGGFILPVSEIVFVVLVKHDFEHVVEEFVLFV